MVATITNESDAYAREVGTALAAAGIRHELDLRSDKIGYKVREHALAKVPLILAAAYYDPRHADLVARETGAKVARMANQAGARPGTDDYVAMVNYNVEQVAAALSGSTAS